MIQESGVSHQPHFVMQCTVGDLVTDGKGNSKKIAKKQAAQEMLNQLLEFHRTAFDQNSEVTTVKKRSKKRSNLIKVNVLR